jgi:hypothetical protein
MANKKFSEFNLKTDPADVDFVVGYDGSENVRIDPANLSGSVAFLTPESQGTVSSVNLGTPTAMLVNDWSNFGSSGEIYTDANGESLVGVGDVLLLQSLNGNYTTPSVTVTGVSGFGSINFNGDLGSTSLMVAEGWNQWGGENLNAILNSNSVLNFTTTLGVLYVTESGINFTGNGTNTINAILTVNDKIYLNSIPLVANGQGLYDPITGKYNNEGKVKQITESGKTGYRIYNENFVNYYGNIGSNAIDLTIQDYQQNRGATGDESVAIGKGSLSSDYNSTAIGFNVQATGNSSFAAGMGSVVSGYASVGIGESNAVSGSNSASIGHINTVTASQSYAYGRQNTLNGDYSSGIGHNNTTTNNYNYAFGFQNKILGAAQYTTAIGCLNNNSGDSAIAIGVGNTITSQNTISIGNSNNTTGSFSGAICVGSSNIGSGNFSIAIGTGVTATGTDSIAIGTVSQATNQNSLSVGEGCISSGFRSSAFGFKSISSANDQTVIGTENDSNANAQFIIGNGLTGNKSNSFEILYDGTVVIKDLPSSSSYANDVDAAAGGVPVGGLYRHVNDVKVRLT